jgi:predicted nucleotidyltransferase
MDAAAPSTFLTTPIQRLVRALAPTRIVLFGSYAKGAERPDSDVDLLVIADVAREPATAMRRARQLVATNFPPIDVVLCTPEDAEHADRAPSPFLQSILESGVAIYARESRRDSPSLFTPPRNDGQRCPPAVVIAGSTTVTPCALTIAFDRSFRCARTEKAPSMEPGAGIALSS